MEAHNESKEAHQYIELLQTDGVNIPVDKDVGTYTMQLPKWYDKEMYKRAQQYYNNNLFAMFAGKLSGLLAVLAVPSILKILVHTKASSAPLTAYRRYLQTVFHTMTWYEEELKVGSRSWKSLEAVRKGHVLASKYTEKGKAGIITQKDMALTQFGFMGFIALVPHKLGIQVNRDDMEAFVHFWRVIGHMVGIQEQFNLCTDSYETTQPRLAMIMKEFYRPYLENTTDEFMSMAKALLEGLWCYNPMLDTQAMIYYVKWISNCKNYLYFESETRALDCNVEDCRKVVQSFGWYTRWILFLQITAHTYLLNFAAIRWYLNFQLWTSKYIIYYFPFLAFFKFGIQASYVRILKGHKN